MFEMPKWKQLVLVVGPALAIGTWGACGSDATTSTVRGRVAQDTFPVVISTIVATGLNGSTHRVAVGSDGAFALTLERHERYRIALEAASTSIPLALRGQHGRYLFTLEVDGGGAEADIGRVRHFSLARMSTMGGSDASRDLRFVAPGLQPIDPAISAAANTVASCTSGYFEGTAEPCMSGAAVQVCVDDDSDSDSDSDSDGDDHQCEDGIDPDGLPCDGGPAANVDGGGEEGPDVELESIEGSVAVPELSLTSIGCDDDEDDDSDSDSEDD